MITLLEKAKKAVRFDHIGIKFDFRASGEANILSKSVFICGKYDFFLLLLLDHTSILENSAASFNRCFTLEWHLKYSVIEIQYFTGKHKSPSQQ